MTDFRSCAQEVRHKCRDRYEYMKKTRENNRLASNRNDRMIESAIQRLRFPYGAHALVPFFEIVKTNRDRTEVILRRLIFT